MGRRLGKANTSVSNVTNDLIPDYPNLRNLGSAQTPFKAIFVEDANLTDDIIFTNPLTGIADNIGTLAATGSTQTDAAAVATTVSRVTGADGTKGVKLPALASVPVGFTVEVINSDVTNALKVYSNAAGELISGVAGTTAVVVASKGTVRFRKYNATNWYASLLTLGASVAFTGNVTVAGTLGSTGLITATAGVTSADNITFSAALKGIASNIATLAGAGSTQADAAAVASTVARVTGANGTVGVKLPALASVPVGFEIQIINSDVTNALKVYSNAAGELISGQAGTTAISVAAKLFLRCRKFDATNWYAEKGVAAY